MKKELGIAVLVVILCVTLSILAPESFLSSGNVHNMLKRIAMYGIFGMGTGIIIITGGIDLSVGAVFALQGVILGYLLNQGQWPWAAAVGISLLACMVMGLFHGFMVAKVKLQPFIVTLCGFMIYRSIARRLTHDATQGLGESDYGWLGQLADGKLHLSRHYDIPSAFIILLVVAAIMWVVLHKSIYGRYLYAIGRNEEAARFSGVNTKLVVASAYVLGLLLAGISGVLLVFDVRSIGPSSFGMSYELYGIAAAVLGGCSLKGGEGSILGVILGTTLLQLLLNLVGLVGQRFGIDSTLEMAVMGTVILIGVLLDQLLKDRKKRQVGAPTLPQPAPAAAKA